MPGCSSVAGWHFRHALVWYLLRRSVGRQGASDAESCLGRPSSASAAQRLESELKRAIVSLELRPGSRLSEADIAERHGVSRQPAREALISLARTKLVEILPQRGTVVAKISVSRMMQARFVREAVETAVVRRAASYFDPAVRERIEGLIEIQEQLARADDHRAFQRYDELFHIALTEGAGCPLAWDAVCDLKTHMDRLCQLTLSDAGTMLGPRRPASFDHRGDRRRRPGHGRAADARASDRDSCEPCRASSGSTPSSSNDRLPGMIDAGPGRVRELAPMFETACYPAGHGFQEGCLHRPASQAASRRISSVPIVVHP